MNTSGATAHHRKRRVPCKHSPPMPLILRTNRLGANRLAEDRQNNLEARVTH